MKKDYYQKKLEVATEEEAVITKKSNQLSLGRLFSFLLFILFLILWIISSKMIYGIFGFLVIIIFVVLIIYHNKVLDQKKYFYYLIDTLKEYLDRFDNRWQDFSSTGANLNEESFLEDLDIIGESSLYKYINICKSKNANKKLKERLSIPEPYDLDLRQKVMVEMADKVDFSLDFQVALKTYDEKSPNLNLIGLLESNNSYSFSSRYYWLMIIQTFISAIILFLSILKIFKWDYFIALYVNQFLLSFLYSYNFKHVIYDLDLTLPALSILGPLYKVIEKSEFVNEQLKEYQNQINRASLGLKRISKLISLDSIRKNFVGQLLNGILPLNLFIVYRYQRLIQEEADNFIKSIEAIEDLEVYASLAIIGQVKEVVTLPKLSQEITLNFKNIKHPLLKEDDCVANSFDLVSHINIITGSNMSGKTSFLRIIGINLILMYAGAYVNAESFVAPYLKIFTSMRIKDDLSKGISTFYAELLRIKEAIDYSEKGQPMIVFIDEIFKGTNANDRITGAISMIKRLNLPNVILFITTHDLEICQVVGINIENYHFSEHYEEDKIKFDYQLKEGICTTTNAKYLMQLTGIIRGDD